ncbi:hypothetical protein ES703_90572 [subsurface metagenome]
MPIPIKDYKTFRNMLIKGVIFRLAEFQFDEYSEKKPRWIIILNDSPPSHKSAKVYFLPVTKNIDYINKNTKVSGLICDKELEEDSAFNLLAVRKKKAKSLYAQYLNNKVSFKGRLSKGNIDYLNRKINDFVNDPDLTIRWDKKQKKSIVKS